MQQPKTLSAQQWQRILDFIYSEIVMTPQQFMEKWGVTQEFIAELCRCDVKTVNRWLAQGQNYSPPLRCHQWELALADLILKDFEGLPDNLKTLLCPNWER
ncbi:MAG TPA: hypothetical protein V6D12_10860 [Candidatus Obscuribacterales bacterium]